MFISKPDKHELNMRQASTVNAQPALLTALDGSQEPAVVIYNMFRVQSVIPVSEALRFANEIADALNAHRKSIPANR